MPRNLVRTLVLPAALGLFGAFFAVASPALAQPGESQIDPAHPDRMYVDAPPRQIHLIVFGDDPCPQASETEIVVCGRRPENERYRLPPRFRPNPNRPPELAWGARALDLENAQRDTRPNSCSPVGSFGQTGCTQMMISQWYADREARRSNTYVP